MSTKKPAAPMESPDPLDSRENQLLAIARHLFAQHGYDRTSLRDIAEAAKITKAALYYYFPNKDALYDRIVLESIQLLYDQVAAEVAKATGPTARVRAFMEASARIQDSGRDRWIAGSNAFWQTAVDGQRMAALKLRDSYEGLLRQCIVDGIAAGEMRAVDPAMAGRLLLSALNHMPRWHKPGGKLSAAQVMQQFLDMLLYGLVLEEPAPPPARRRKAAA
ncbi:TetR/AcrR family transcriptional regulator [Hydrogenophaga sp. BPS33]|uniref:TetR/AcrR family transcriptional regulator n=1 Tax=Hydrogenophaga sp. BPS33 TaxID=2651974 RepID=UPI00131F9B09|nr:TetR/AcrR family transcriptional regulator [Hydrogenophaga sp. BPS33]QHE84502.1 TetR/AcrR family transcriptional regulator [Hydrogenophaga sp. BPS33]